MLPPSDLTERLTLMQLDSGHQKHTVRNCGLTAKSAMLLIREDNSGPKLSFFRLDISIFIIITTSTTGKSRNDSKLIGWWHIECYIDQFRQKLRKYVRAQIPFPTNIHPVL